jgi:5-oxoprolinase (ATP-hydrolysing) subunit A
MMDLNSDVGEGFGAWGMADDTALLKVITSANIACGFHAGDPSIMRARCVEAATRGVAIGAHVGYRDLAGFGRRYMAYEATELADAVLYQLAALDGVARSCGTAVGYVKPHGALYGAAFGDPVQAGAVVAAIRAYGAPMAVLCQPSSELSRCAEVAGLRVVPEAFVDRAYTHDGRLVPRGEPGALLTDSSAVVHRALLLAVEGEVVAIDGARLSLGAESLCLHGDTPGAVALAEAIRAAFLDAGVSLASFVSISITTGARA